MAKGQVRVSPGFGPASPVLEVISLIALRPSAPALAGDEAAGGNRLAAAVR